MTMNLDRAVMKATAAGRGSKGSDRCIPPKADMTARFIILATLVAAGAFAGSLVALAAAGSNASVTFTVHSSDDATDGACDLVHCSLREAIIAANGNPGADTIAFDISGPPPHTIQPTSELPAATDPVTIDGTTQSRYVGNLIVELDGSAVEAYAAGLRINEGSTVRGLVINRFSTGITLDGDGGSVIEGNFIGTDVTGTIDLGNGGAGPRERL